MLNDHPVTAASVPRNGVAEALEKVLAPQCVDAFRNALNATERLFAELASLPNLTVLQHAQALALSLLAGHTFTRLHPDDGAHKLRSLGSDLEAIWTAVDPLVETIGSYAGAYYHGIEQDDFRGQLRGALEGNATYVLEAKADRMDEQARR